MTRDPDLTYCAQGHIMTIMGGTNCGCHPDAQCSLPVYSCRTCGDSDYGDNKHAEIVKQVCAEHKACARQQPALDELPGIHLTKAEFEALPEYSVTNPTGVYIGKRWRRHDGAHDPKCKKPVWLIGEYKPLFGRDDCALIEWSIPVIRLDAPLGT